MTLREDLGEQEYYLVYTVAEIEDGIQEGDEYYKVNSIDDVFKTYARKFYDCYIDEYIMDGGYVDDMLNGYWSDYPVIVHNSEGFVTGFSEKEMKRGVMEYAEEWFEEEKEQQDGEETQGKLLADYHASVI